MRFLIAVLFLSFIFSNLMSCTRRHDGNPFIKAVPMSTSQIPMRKPSNGTVDLATDY